MLLALVQSSSAFASDNLWLVMRVDVDNAKPEEVEATQQLPQVLRSRGVDVLDGAGAASELERRHSRTAKPLSDKQTSELDASVRKLADELSSENLENAQQLQTEIDALSPDIRDQLNHEKPRAQRRFHICLLTAHLFSKQSRESESVEQIKKCARDFPGLEPEQSPYLPDTIRNFFAHSAEVLARIRPSSIHIDLESYGIKDCRARVNGIDRGPTPATVDEVRTQRVRIQVDCAKQPGRIYDVELQPGDNSFRIDPVLDRAVQPTPGLGLKYVDATAANNNRLLHSLRLGRAVGAAWILEIYNGELHRIDVQTRRDTIIGEITTPLDELVDQILTVPEASRSVDASLVAGSSDSRPSTPFQTLGWISAGAAVLTGVGVIIAWRMREGAVGKFNREGGDDQCISRFAVSQPSDCPSFLRDADSAQDAMKVLGFSGIALAGLATTFFVLDATQGSSREHSASNGCGPGPGELGVSCKLKF